MTKAGLDVSFGPIVARDSEVLGSNPGRGRIFVLGVVHIQFAKLFKGPECASPGFGLPSVAILP